MGLLLLVEDDDDIREDLAEVLRDEGHRVVEARDGAEALERLGDSETPCLILLDLMMPRMDGWQFCAEQRKDPSVAHVPVVLLSGAGDLARHAEDLAAAAVVRKPFRLEPLLALVARYCPPDAAF